jgi:hypothetical protein
MLDSWRSSKRRPPRVYLAVRPGGEEELDCGFCGETFVAGRAAAQFGVACWRLTARGLVFDAVVTAGVMDQEAIQLEGFVDDRTPHRKLHDGAKQGNIPLMRLALAEGADPNMIDDAHSVFSPLHIAAACCKPEAVATLLSVGARADIETVHGSTPMMMALVVVSLRGYERDKRLIVNHLISAGADVNERSDDYGCPFSQALNRGFRWILLDLLRAGAEVDTVIGSILVTTLAATDTVRAVEAPRSGVNASAWALVDAIKKAGDFDEYARRQLNIHISMLTKCFGTALPVDAWSHVAGFYAPRGFY